MTDNELTDNELTDNELTDNESDFRAGFVAVVGRPNVGKSTVMNRLVGQTVAAVSAKPQMTRKQQFGIYTDDQVQIVFVDTPGMHVAKHKLGDAMNQAAEIALLDGDVILWIVDGGQPPKPEDVLIAERINALENRPPLLMALNKTDLLTKTEREERVQQFQNLMPDVPLLEISAYSGENLNVLMEKLIPYMPLGAPFYDKEQVTDFYERDIAIELIRQAVLENLHDEVPHAVAVRLDEYADRGEEKAYISATLFVERDSQKGILIGKNGSMIKEIGMLARKEIEGLTGRQVFLDLRVKVHKNWRNNPDALRLMGYGAREE